MEAEAAHSDFSERQSDVLQAACDLLSDDGAARLTMANVASAANCSKESLYKWFGDRRGLLVAMVEHQAARVPVTGEGSADAKAELEAFAAGLLDVLLSPQSLALNRLAVGAGSAELNELGQIMVARGRQPVEDRGLRLLEGLQAQGAVKLPDMQSAFQNFYGLVVGDAHLMALLGQPRTVDHNRRAHEAVAQFCKLYSTH